MFYLSDALQDLPGGSSPNIVVRLPALTLGWHAFGCRYDCDDGGAEWRGQRRPRLNDHREIGDFASQSAKQDAKSFRTLDARHYAVICCGKPGSVYGTELPEDAVRHVEPGDALVQSKLIAESEDRTAARNSATTNPSSRPASNRAGIASQKHLSRNSPPALRRYFPTIG